MPIREQKTERTAAQIVTPRKLLKIRIADSAGKITSAEISRDPTRFMASTMMTAMMTVVGTNAALWGMSATQMNRLALIPACTAISLTALSMPNIHSAQTP